MLEISSFFVFQGNSVFQLIEQAKLNRAFFARYGEPSQAELFGRHGEPSQAELFCPKAQAKTELSRAELWLGPNTNSLSKIWHIKCVIYYKQWTDGDPDRHTDMKN